MMHESSFLHSHIRDTTVVHVADTCTPSGKRQFEEVRFLLIVVHELKVENAELGQEAQNLR
jgi:hypothetical protein